MLINIFPIDVFLLSTLWLVFFSFSAVWEKRSINIFTTFKMREKITIYNFSGSAANWSFNKSWFLRILCVEFQYISFRWNCLNFFWSLLWKLAGSENLTWTKISCRKSFLCYQRANCSSTVNCTSNNNSAKGKQTKVKFMGLFFISNNFNLLLQLFFATGVKVCFDARTVKVLCPEGLLWGEMCIF